jgi:hypothetical protein
MIISKRITEKRYYCSEHKLKKNSLIFVCKEEGCRSKGLICSLCRQEYHTNHDVVEVDQLVEEAESCSHDQELAIVLEQLLRDVKLAKEHNSAVLKAINKLSTIFKE